MKSILAILLLFGPVQGIQQKEPHKDQQKYFKQVPIELTETSSKLVTKPAFQYIGNTQCDSDSNIYRQASGNQDYSGTIVVKLKTDGNYKIYSLPSEDVKNDLVLFRVNPEGKLRILDQGKQSGKLYVHEFSSEGSEATRTELEVPVGLMPTSFLVLGNDHIQIYGLLNDDAVPSNRGKSYFGEFESSGKLVQQSNDSASQNDVQNAVNTAATNAVAEALDGYSYILAGNKVLVLSAAGKILEKRQIETPEEGYWPANIFTDGAFLVVAFFKMPEKGGIYAFHAMFQLLNRQTGELIRTYKPGQIKSNSLACFTSEGFILTSIEHGKLKLITAKP